ncbi:winged helix-turn-helix domain-containing protein [Sodalis sp. RH19]|uniref:winged helix-turn-helix domain-containing protein n=1 Tax=Sodalis sp. RH19 TaxID=3394334 RepID=UPI0039B3AFCF
MKLTQPITINHLDVTIAPNIHSRLRWKEYQILNLLIQNSPAAVTRAELVNQIWKGTYCSDSTINQTIKSIRQKLGDENHDIIKTIPRIGYIIEEKQMVNIFFNPQSVDEYVPEPLRPEPAQATAATAATAARMTCEQDIQETATMEDAFFDQPTWALPPPSRITKTITRPTVNRSNPLKDVSSAFAARIQQTKSKIILGSMAFFILSPLIMYSFSTIKIPFASYALELARFNKVNAVTLTCPLGYNSSSSDAFSCKSLTVKFDGVAFDCQVLGEK